MGSRAILMVMGCAGLLLTAMGIGSQLPQGAGGGFAVLGLLTLFAAILGLEARRAGLAKARVDAQQNERRR